MALALVVWDAHLRLLARTRVVFEVSFERQALQRGYSATLNGSPVASGNLVRPGSGRLVISFPDAETVERKAFIWYGTNDFGSFDLVAHKGVLDIAADPPPMSVAVTGQWFRASTTNAPFRFDAVPVGSYQISMAYPWLRVVTNVAVRRGETARIEIAPSLGVLEVASEPADSTFAVASLTRSGVSSTGRTPSTLRHLPAGEYRLRVWRGDYLKESKMEIRTRETNRVAVVFDYGQVQLISDPPGATVFDGDKEIGLTPRVFAELKPGDHRYRLELAGYQSASVAFKVEGKEPLTVRTNLINIAYATAMSEASALAGSQRYDQALASVAKALETRPGDEAATKLKADLETAFQSAEGRRAEEQRVAALDQRRRQLADGFQQATTELKDAALFDTFTWTARAPIERVLPAVRRALETGAAKWTVDSEQTMEDKGAKFNGTGKGLLIRRRCVIMVNPVAADEVVVQGKFWDYILSSQIQIFGGKDSNWLPVHPNHVQAQNPGEIEQRRKALPEAFWKALQADIQ